MECPSCGPRAPEGSPYRGASHEHQARPQLAEAAHLAGVTLDACASCGGVWLDHGELERVENAARSRGDGSRAEATAGLLRRAYERPRSPSELERAELRCPRCGEELFEREWGFSTLVRVDVCIGCRGTWLEAGELDALEELWAAR